LDAQDLKDRIIEENKIYDVLSALGMHHIKDKGKYYSCAMPAGDNEKSTIVYKDNLFVDAYTRDIKDKYGSSDLLSLTMFLRQEYFSHSMKWICEMCGYDYYGRDYEKPSLLSFINEIYAMKTSYGLDDDDTPLKPINEKVLEYYRPLKSKMFYEDGVDYETQNLFGVGIDLCENRITFPIYDEHNILVGVKGRLNQYEILPFENKYIYLEKCNKNHILYGLNLTYEHVKKAGIVYVVESEKAVMQGWSTGIKNVVAISGKHPSSTQIKKLTYLGVDICLCLDDKADCGKDGNIDTDFYNKIANQFIDTQKVYAIIDKKNEILGHKQSPFDNLDMWDELLKMRKLIQRNG